MSTHLTRFGQRLREVREQEQMTQSELAQKAGMTAMHVSHFECGRRLPSLENFAALMRVLGDHSEYLLGLEGFPQACDHEEHDHGICIHCGADITDTLAGQAEDAADAAQDR